MFFEVPLRELNETEVVLLRVLDYRVAFTDLRHYCRCRQELLLF
jgi:hypothetical protein